MSIPVLYRGVWPSNVSKLAKYAVRFVGGEWKITVLYDVGDGLQYLAVEGGQPDLVLVINDVKSAVGDQPGGAFYVNEYRHIIVPVGTDQSSGTGAHYYYAGRLEGDFRFEFEGQPLTTRPVRVAPSARGGEGDWGALPEDLGLSEEPLHSGDRWVGPRPGIPYVLAAGGGDIYYETPALTDEDPPAVRPMMTRKVQLSKILRDKSLVGDAVKPIADLRGHQGGRFYVNEHRAIFTPVDAGDGNGLDYLYCGQVNPHTWFPEPITPGADTRS